MTVTLNGEDHAKVFGKPAVFIEREDGKDQSALLLRDVSLSKPGAYRIRVTDGTRTRELSWNVYGTGARKAKNVILFIGDGMSFLMVESGLIDKYSHLLDMERAVYDTIMLDNAVKLARDWARGRGDDTLILVLADHNHPIGLVGTIEDDMSSVPNLPMRERVRVYGQAGFPNYPAPDADGYPPRVDVSRRLALFSASLPDHYETFRPKLDKPNDPTVAGKEPGTFVANEQYKGLPGAILRFGNLPAMMNASVHSGEDVILTAMGPGSDRVRGQIENTEVFRVIAEALGLGHDLTSAAGVTPEETRGRLPR